MGVPEWIQKEIRRLDANSKLLHNSADNFQSTGHTDTHEGLPITKVATIEGRVRTTRKSVLGVEMTIKKHPRVSSVVVGEELIQIPEQPGGLISVDQAMQLLGERDQLKLGNALKTRRNDPIYNIA